MANGCASIITIGLSGTGRRLRVQWEDGIGYRVTVAAQHTAGQRRHVPVLSYSM